MKDSSCSCHSKTSAADTVPLAAFEALQRRVEALGDLLREVAQGVAESPGAAPPPLMRGMSAPERSMADARSEERMARVIERTTRITNGYLCEPGEFPHCVLLGRRFGSGKPDWFCSGVLIHPRVVISAGHCNPGQPNLVRLNVIDKDEMEAEGEMIPIVKHYIPDRYLSGNEVGYDIAVYILARAAGTSPVSCASFEDLAQAQETMLVGFGTTDINGRHGFGIQRKVPVPFLSLRRDQAAILESEESRYFYDADSEFVAGNPAAGQDTCKGDSGGPAYIRVGNEWLLAGVTSRGIPNSDLLCSKGGIYTRLDAHQNWITECARRARIQEPA